MKNSLLKRSIGVGALFFMTVMNGQSTAEIIQGYISSDVSFKGAQKAIDFKILNEDNSVSLRSNIVDVQQVVNGIPVYHSLAKAVIKDGRMFSFKNNFDKTVTVSKFNQLKTTDAAFASALADVGILDHDYKLIPDGNVVNNPSSKDVANFAYYYQKDNKLVPARLFFIDDSKNNAFWQVLINLENNEVLEKQNMVLSCNFHDEAYDATENGEHVHVMPGYIEDQINTAQKASTAAVANASYNVFPFPIEAPTYGSRAMLTNPWDVTASPLGWHDTGAASYTYTRGNNVWAYFDNEGKNTPPTTDITDGGSALNFDFPYAEGPNVSAYDSKHAAITNLFYANNMIHDVFYKFGFTESAKNFQTSNFDKGGRGNDAVRAEAYDGSGYNNANFNAGYETATTVAAPRMQMFLWKSGALGIKQKLFYNSPADAVARPPVAAGEAKFGKTLFSVATTGDVVIPNIANGCSSMASMSNKIALISYSPGTPGECSLVAKVKNAQNAGAKGVIMHRTNTDAPMDMNGTDSTILIPSVLVGNSEGEYIKTQVNNGITVNVDLKDMGNGYKNSSFDNGVIIHEYGHGISNRLTGDSMGCLNSSSTKEQMGEGWSDFFALMLTNRPEYTASTARGIATYSDGQSAGGQGIRDKKYSPDFAVNNFTYANTNGMEYFNGTSIVPNVHAIGTVWATMLWDLHWKYADKYGYSADIVANPNSGSAKVVQLVMDGLKLQPCYPTFVSGRDAIIEAEVINGGADECMIWEVFAKRGLGVNASAGSSTNINDQVENFDLPEKCKLATFEVGNTKAYNVYPNPAKGEFFIAGKPTLSQASVKVEILDMTGKVIKSFERKKNSVEAVSTNHLPKGVYVVTISENSKTVQTDKLIIE